MSLKIDEAFANVLEEAFPNMDYEWNGHIYTVQEVAAPNGLLPIIMRQAVATSYCLPFETDIRDKIHVESVNSVEAKNGADNTMTGLYVEFDDGLPVLFTLLLAQDAVAMAFALSPKKKKEKRIVDLSMIWDPIEISPDTVFRPFGYVGERQPKNQKASKEESVSEAPSFGMGMGY